MKFVSWNVFNLNDDPAAFRALIHNAGADVLALQELTADYLAHLRSLADYRVFSADDFVEDGVTSCLGIVTRLPASHHTVITHNPERTVSDSIQGRRKGWRECLDSQAVTVTCGGTAIRVVNLRLPCGVSPRVRLRDLETAAAHIEGADHAVVCGDFNMFARPVLNLLGGWFFGIAFSELLTNEHRTLGQFDHTHSLQRIFDRVATFSRFRL